jgi:hypothetical protein
MAFQEKAHPPLKTFSNSPSGSIICHLGRCQPDNKKVAKIQSDAEHLGMLQQALKHSLQS